MEIKALKPDDVAAFDCVAPDVFDDPIDRHAAVEFLCDPRHHLVVAIDDDVVVGFASAVHYVHPDKPAPELWINEVGVASSHRGRGVGRAIVAALLERGRALGCRDAWVLTEPDNQPALRLYQAAGGVRAPVDTVMFTFSLKTD